MRRIILSLCLLVSLGGCQKSSKPIITIYTSSDEYSMSLMSDMLTKKFPDYKINIEYLTTGDQAAKLKAEGSSTEADIAYDLEYGYLSILEEEGVLENIDAYDRSKYLDELNISDYYVPTLRYGGAIIINTEVLAEKGLEEPKSYQDLLKPEYKSLISMPNPNSSGTGYMFLKSLVNAWGDDRAFAYFDALSDNILQYTSSGSGPVNALVNKEVAIGLGMTSQAALMITNGNPLKILFFEEGSPYTACGTAIIKGHGERTEVQEVFKYIYTDVCREICKQYYPEQIYKDEIFTMENYPENIHYADMNNNTQSEKERLLAKWTH